MLKRGSPTRFSDANVKKGDRKNHEHQLRSPTEDELLHLKSSEAVSTGARFLVFGSSALVYPDVVVEAASLIIAD